MTTPAPFVSSEMIVQPEWIDYNGHMNMAYYTLLFDRCADEAYAYMGFGAEYAATSGFTTYTGAFQIRYLRELHRGDRVRVHLHLLDHDDKKFHTWQELYHADGWLAATGEALGLHIDQNGPKVAPFPAEILARLEAMKAAHEPLGRPPEAGRPIGIRRKTAVSQ